jgi:crotonobetainyl-CoA:carnitine CoA-transferase CaiB-like acyl-CoA transferase
MRFIEAREDCAGQSPYFLSVNHDKRSLLVNLKSSSGTEIIHRLAATADILVENFRPGVMQRLGIGYDAISAVAPQIIYCSISGYGQSGPWRDYPAYDNVVQAISGMVSTTGEEGDLPMQAGFAPCDSFAGQLATQAILAAVLKRERFGGGDLIDVSMLDAALVLMAPVVGAFLVSGQPKPRQGNRGFGVGVMPGVDLFVTQKGHLMMSAYFDAQFVNLWPLLGRDDLKAETRFATVEGRAENGAELREILRTALLQRGALDWEASLNPHGIPAAAVRGVPNAVEEPHVKERRILQPLHIPGAKRQNMQVLGLGYEMGGIPPRASIPAPQAGQHTAELLEEAGYTTNEIEKFRGDGVVA